MNFLHKYIKLRVVHFILLKFILFNIHAYALHSLLQMDILILIYFHHGGRFIDISGDMFYQGEKLTPRHGLDANRVSYLVFVDEVEKMGYKLKNMCYRVLDG